MLVEHNPVSQSILFFDVLASFLSFLADAYTAIPRTPSPGKRVEFFIDNNQPNPKRSLSPGSGIADIIESPEHEKVPI